MTDSEDYAESAAILEAILPVLAAGEDDPVSRGLPVAFVGVIEMMGDDGQMYLRIIRSPSTTPAWRMLGMIEFMAADVRSRASATESGESE